MVDFITSWFSKRVKESWPYKSNWTKLSFEISSKSFMISNGLIEFIRVARWTLWSGQSRRKCIVDSTLRVQLQISVGVSVKLCLNLWAFRGLRPTRSWKSLLVPSGSKISNIDFFLGRIILRKFDLKIESEFAFLMVGSIVFHELITSRWN